MSVLVNYLPGIPEIKFFNYQLPLFQSFEGVPHRSWGEFTSFHQIFVGQGPTFMKKLLDCARRGWKWEIAHCIVLLTTLTFKDAVGAKEMSYEIIVPIGLHIPVGIVRTAGRFM
jgi:hypothetical protein